MYISPTDRDLTPTLTVNIPNTDAKLNLTKSETYDLLTQLSRQLTHRFGDMNYLINADNVIVALKGAYNGETTSFYADEDDKKIISDFFTLDKDTQRDIASDALDDIVSTYEVCDIEVPLVEVLGEILDKAALAIVKPHRTA